MLHDIAPHVYSNAFHPHPARLEDKTLCFAQGGVYLREDGSFPLRRDYPAEAEVLYLFDYDGAGVYLSREAPLGCALRPVRALRELAQPDAFLGGTAQHLSDWYGMTRFCGRCGAKMTHSATERAMVCPACGNTVYPRISPAVIVLITCGERILLAQGKHYAGSSIPSSPGIWRSARAWSRRPAARRWRRRACTSATLRTSATSPGPLPTRRWWDFSPAPTTASPSACRRRSCGTRAGSRGTTCPSPRRASPLPAP